MRETARGKSYMLRVRLYEHHPNSTRHQPHLHSNVQVSSPGWTLPLNAKGQARQASLYLIWR